MTATRTFKQVEGHPKFAAFAAHPARWTHTGPDGIPTTAKDFRIEGAFGSVESAVVVAQNGEPAFDRPLYREIPNVNIVAFGRDLEGKIRMGIIRQPRPHADDPEQPGNDHDPVVFGQIPMGFLEKLIGKDLEPRLETGEAGAKREVQEETGAAVVCDIKQPAYPFMFPNPTFCATWSDVWFVEVDLASIERLKHDRHEPIFSAEYVTVPELLRRIREGKDERGAVYRMGISLADLMLFFATYPHFFCAE